jgi:hypothetical protein
VQVSSPNLGEISFTLDQSRQATARPVIAEKSEALFQMLGVKRPEDLSSRYQWTQFYRDVHSALQLAIAGDSNNGVNDKVEAAIA